MLPSGNDAALILAHYFGSLLLPLRQDFEKRFINMAASELSVSETDGDIQSTEGEEVKIGIETELQMKCTSSVPIS